MCARARSISASSRRIFDKSDIHVHVPEGATPKDGPSAGIAMVTAIVSVMTGIPVRKDVAMTGEITLRGRVLPIGGLKEKLLAALRGGIKKVLIPEENAKDLAEIPDNVKSGLEIIPVARMDEVLKHVLTAHAASRSSGTRRLKRPPGPRRQNPRPSRSQLIKDNDFSVPWREILHVVGGNSARAGSPPVCDGAEQAVNLKNLRPDFGAAAGFPQKRGLSPGRGGASPISKVTERILTHEQE